MTISPPERGSKSKVQVDRNPAPADFDSLTRLQRRVTGKYNEIITLEGAGAEKKHYFTRGSFVLNRISSHPALGVGGTQTVDTPGADLGSESAREAAAKKRNRVDGHLRLSCLLRVDRDLTVTAPYW